MVLLDDGITPSEDLLNSNSFRFLEGEDVSAIVEFCARAYLFSNGKVLAWQEANLAVFMDFSKTFKIIPKVLSNEEVTAKDFSTGFSVALNDFNATPAVSSEKEVATYTLQGSRPKFKLDVHQCNSYLGRAVYELKSSSFLFLCLTIPKNYIGLGIKSVVDATMIQLDLGYATPLVEDKIATVNSSSFLFEDEVWLISTALSSIQFYNISEPVPIFIAGSASLKSKKSSRTNIEESGDRKLLIEEMAFFNITLLVMSKAATLGSAFVMKSVLSSVTLLLVDSFLL